MTTVAPMPRRRPRTRRADERGAALLELALVVPILIMLVMGIVDFSSLSSDKIALRNGVREASWNGAKAVFGSTVPCDSHIDSSGQAPTAETRRIMCMVKSRSDLDETNIRVKVVLVDLDTRATGVAYGFGKGLLVCAMRKPASATGFFTSLFAGSVQVSRLTSPITKMPTNPAQVISGGQETPFAGANWTFCDPNQPLPD